MCMLTSHSAQKKGRGRQLQHRTTAGFLPDVGRFVLPCFLVPQWCSPDGVSLSSEKRLCRVLQFEEARRGSLRFP